MNYAARCLKILVEQVTRNITLPIYFSQVKLSLLFSSLPKNRLVHEQMFSSKNGDTTRHPEFTCTFCGFCSSGFENVVFINNSKICKSEEYRVHTKGHYPIPNTETKDGFNHEHKSTMS